MPTMAKVRWGNRGRVQAMNADKPFVPRRDKSTKENRAYWDYVERILARVKHWPEMDVR